MVTAKDLTALEFENMDRYFSYIIESLYNGQYGQVRELIADMDIHQRSECYSYILMKDRSEELREGTASTITRILIQGGIK